MSADSCKHQSTLQRALSAENLSPRRVKREVHLLRTLAAFGASEDGDILPRQVRTTPAEKISKASTNDPVKQSSSTAKYSLLIYSLHVFIISCRIVCVVPKTLVAFRSNPLICARQTMDLQVSCRIVLEEVGGILEPIVPLGISLQ